MENELYHHGIKGMKWGVRRYQNKDGSLTPEGKRRQAADQRVAETKAAYKSAKKAYSNSYGEAYNKSLSAISPIKKHRENNKARWEDAQDKFKVANKAKAEYQAAKKDRKELISGEKEPKEKSKHRQKLEAKYREQGMNEQQAAAAADRRIQIEKTVAIVGGMTVAAATAYAANKYVKNNVDRVIKSGTTIQRMTQNPSETYDRPFYASYKKGDNLKYRGIMGAKHFGGENVHKVTLNANSNVKVASRKKSVDAFMDLYKNDPEFKKAFSKSFDEGAMSWQFGSLDKMTDKELRTKGYDAMNTLLVNRSEAGSTASGKFYNKMKELGYDAVQDVNDQKYSGYDAKMPVIVFNNAGKLTKTAVEKMSSADIADDEKRARTKMYVEAIGKEAAKSAAVTGGGLAALAYVSNTSNKIAVDNYRIKHPNTKMSDEEILKNVYGVGESR